jgi:hypothetical protein
LLYFYAISYHIHLIIYPEVVMSYWSLLKAVLLSQEVMVQIDSYVDFILVFSSLILAWASSLVSAVAFLPNLFRWHLGKTNAESGLWLWTRVFMPSSPGMSVSITWHALTSHTIHPRQKGISGLLPPNSNKYLSLHL